MKKYLKESGNSDVQAIDECSIVDWGARLIHGKHATTFYEFQRIALLVTDRCISFYIKIA